MSNIHPEFPLLPPPFQRVPNCLRSHPLHRNILSAVSAALAALNPATCISNHVRWKGDTWIAGPHRFHLSPKSRIRVAGGGKAGLAMARELFTILGDRIEIGAVAVPSQPENPPARIGNIHIFPAGHPVPDAAGVRAARAVLDTARGLHAEDLLIVPISGGASALLTLPSDGLSLADVQTLTTQLLLSGADIESMNIIRKHLSAVKGGRLAEVAGPARVCALILSDVVGDPIEAIGSGPTAPDRSTFTDARERLERFGIAHKIPPHVLEYLRQGENGTRPETPKPGNAVFENVFNLVIGGNRSAAKAAADHLSRHGIYPVLVEEPLTGEARAAGKHIVEKAREALASKSIPRPVCLIFGGETTVSVRGNGKGGRNQETALAAALALVDLRDVGVLTFATDGKDGPTDAAGATATHETLSAARRHGLDPIQFLNDNNSYRFFESLGDLLHTGPTGTNAADLTFVFFQ